MELRPRMLKDCLLEDSNSCSSNGFKSFPRRVPLASFPKKKQSNPLKAVINAVKNLKSAPSVILPRSLSKRKSSSNKNKVEKHQTSIITVVRVKDIVRWNSSKDLHDEEQEEENISHFKPSPQPNHYIAKTTTTTTKGSSTTTTSAATSCSSWCESEFLQSSWGSNVEEECSEKENSKKNLLSVSEDSCTAITVADTEEDLQSEKEQNSPVSVFEIQHEEDDEEEVSDSSFSQCLDNVERTKEKLMQTIQRFENLANLNEWVSMDEEESDCDTVDREIEEEADEVEEKATYLWNQVKERHAIWIHEEHLIMDYFRDELTNLFQETYRDHQHLVSKAKGWLQGKRESELEQGSGDQRREACAREIERRDWNEKRMNEERDEVALEIEDSIFSTLLDETLTALHQVI